MALTSAKRWWYSRKDPTRIRTSFRPRVVPLEDRWLPSLSFFSTNYFGFFSGEPAYAGSQIKLLWNYQPDSFSDTFTGTIHWGDGKGSSLGDGTFFNLGEGNGEGHPGTFEGEHTYAAPGKYTLTFEADESGNFTTAPSSISETRTINIHTFRVPIFTFSPAFNQSPGQPLVGNDGFPGDTGPVTVIVRNAGGQPDPSFNGGVTLTLNDPNNTGAVLSGNHANAVAGVAQFPNLKVGQTGFTFSLTPSIDGETDVDGTGLPSNNFNVLSHLLKFSPQPAGGSAGSAMDVKVGIGLPDQQGDFLFDESFRGNVQLTLQGGPNGATLVDDHGNPLPSITESVSAGFSGLLDFPDVRINKPSQYTLMASIPAESGVQPVTSSPFNIAGHSLLFAAVPANGVAGDPLSDTRVEVDLQGSGIDSSFNDAVNLSIASGPSGATLEDAKGNSLPSVTVNASSGLADFQGLRLSKGGQYTFSASLPSEQGITAPATSSSFPVAPHTIAIQLPSHFAGAPGDPLPDFTVQALGPDSNVDANFSGHATLSLTPVPGKPGGNGVLTSTSVSIVAGQGTVHGVGVTLTGTYTLTATLDAEGVTSQPTSSFIVGRTLKLLQGPPAKGVPGEPLGAPVLTNGAATTPVEVEVLAGDPADNIVDTGFQGTVQITDTQNNVVNGQAAVGQNALGKPTAGVAIFNTLAISAIGNGYTLTASLDDGVTPNITIGPFDIIPHVFALSVVLPDPTAPDKPGVPNHEVTGAVVKGYVVGETPSAANLQPLVVEAFDANGDLDPTFKGQVALGFAPGGNPGNNPNPPSGGTVTADGGKAQFGALMLTKPGAGYQFNLTAEDQPSILLGKPFNVTSDQLAFDTILPRDVGVLEFLKPGLVVDVRDNQGAIDRNFDGPVTIQTATHPALDDLAGKSQKTVNAVAGVATFSLLAFTGLGDYTLSASLADGTATFPGLSPTITVKQHTLQFAVGLPAFGLPGEPLNPTVEVQVLLDDQVDQAFDNIGVTLKPSPGDPPGFFLPGVVGVPGPASALAHSGIATFPAFAFNQIGQGLTFLVDDAPGDPTLTSSPVDILPHNLHFSTPPVTGHAGLPLPQVIVQVLMNPVNQLDTVFQGPVQLTLADAAGHPLPAGGTTLQNGTSTVQQGQAQAVFGNLVVSQPGTYSLIATIPASETTAAEGQEVESSPFVVNGNTANGQDVAVNGAPNASNTITVGSGGNGSLAYNLNGSGPVNQSDVNSFTYNGTGNDSMTVQVPPVGTLAASGIFFNGSSSGGSLTIDASGQYVAVSLNNVTVGDPQLIHYTKVQTLNLNDAVAVDTLPGPDTVDRTAALSGLTGNARLVQLLYLDNLGRPGDTTNGSDAGSWVNQLNSGMLTPAAAAKFIASSFEARSHQVQSWYEAFLGRRASGNEALGWVSGLQQGQTVEQVLSQILGSTEFFQRAQSMVSTGTAAQRYVQSLYELLLTRQADGAQLAGWVNAMPLLGQNGVALSFLSSVEFRTNQFEGYYNALLHRPDDSAGISALVASSLDLQTIRLAFESSPEFALNG